MRKLSLYLILTLVLFSCQSRSDDNSFAVEDKEALITKLADMYFMDSYIARTAKSEKDSLREKLHKEFYQLHNITVTELDEYLTNLKTNKKLFGEIMDSVSVVLSTQSKKK